MKVIPPDSCQPSTPPISGLPVCICTSISCLRILGVRAPGRFRLKPGFLITVGLPEAELRLPGTPPDEAEGAPGGAGSLPIDPTWTARHKQKRFVGEAFSRTSEGGHIAWRQSKPKNNRTCSKRSNFGRSSSPLAAAWSEAHLEAIMNQSRAILRAQTSCAELGPGPTEAALYAHMRGPGLQRSMGLST